MKYLFLTSRCLLGSVLLLFGLNGFLNFYPLPETTPQAKEFLNSLWASGYLMYLEKSVEVIVGLFLLLNRFVPASLLILLPISVNILLVDVLLQPQYWYYGGSVFFLNLILIVQNRAAYRTVLSYEMAEE